MESEFKTLRALHMALLSMEVIPARAKLSWKGWNEFSLSTVDYDGRPTAIGRITVDGAPTADIEFDVFPGR